MIWYATPSGIDVCDVIAAGLLGCIHTPKQGNVVFPDEWDMIADNGCYVSPAAAARGERWDEQHWRRWITDQPRTMRFAVAPDVFHPDGTPAHGETLERWQTFGPLLARLGYTPAFVAQIGCTPDLLPDDAPVVFLGGTDKWKVGDEARAITAAAKADGRWVHMGRVNTRQRMVTAIEFGCDSSDGTCLAFGPDKNLPLILRYLREAHQTVAQATLPL